MGLLQVSDRSKAVHTHNIVMPFDFPFEQKGNSNTLKGRGGMARLSLTHTALHSAPESEQDGSLTHTAPESEQDGSLTHTAPPLSS
ncbi:UNVERIFIED_CONTAM: hypothetical protein FKN15_009120 [Acipenser sinensis]